MSKTVTALFKTADAATHAVDRLMAAGVSRDDISLLMSDETRGREFGIEEHSKAPEGAATGAAIGGTLGAIIAGLVAVGTLAVPGVGLLAAGPIVAVLAGAGAGGASGGVIGGLIGLGIEEHEAKLYADEIKEGRILLGVECHEDRVDKIREILEHSGTVAVN